jgi:hypothetical protein
MARWGKPVRGLKKFDAVRKAEQRAHTREASRHRLRHFAVCSPQHPSSVGRVAAAHSSLHSNWHGPRSAGWESRCRGVTGIDKEVDCDQLLRDAQFLSPMTTIDNWDRIRSEIRVVKKPGYSSISEIALGVMVESLGKVIFTYPFRTICVIHSSSVNALCRPAR